MSEFGSVRYCKVIRDKEGKSRGYGFVEFERTHHFKRAYNEAEGLKIEGRRIGIDCEYARTNPNFRPMIIGGGIGKSKKSINNPFKKYTYKSTFKTTRI